MQDKPIVFLHFHKAGGTTINKVFEGGPRRKFPRHANGNPYSKHGPIPLWTFKPKRLAKFRAKLDRLGVGFVALEWNFFQHHASIDWSAFHFLTVLRDPYERFISNMNFDGACKPKAYMRKRMHVVRKGVRIPVSFNRPNYYVRMLNGLGGDPDAKLGRAHLQRAQRVLARFDTVLVLEDPGTFGLLRPLGARRSPSEVKKNVAKGKKRYWMGRAAFERRNRLDRQLYRFAVRLVADRARGTE